jgi:hypothetical protein
MNKGPLSPGRCEAVGVLAFILDPGVVRSLPLATCVAVAIAD